MNTALFKSKEGKLLKLIRTFLDDEGVTEPYEDPKIEVFLTTLCPNVSIQTQSIHDDATMAMSIGEFLDRYTEECQSCTRMKHMVENIGSILFVGQLARYSEVELKKCRNVGKHTIDYLKACLAEAGVSLDRWKTPVGPLEQIALESIPSNVVFKRAEDDVLISRFPTLGDVAKASRAQLTAAFQLETEVAETLARFHLQCAFEKE